MRCSPCATVAPFFARLAYRVLRIARVKPSRSIGGLTLVSPHLPRAATLTNFDHQRSTLLRKTSKSARHRETVASKARVNLRFDSLLLAKADAAAKRQGITRTAWLHRAAFDALDKSGAADPKLDQWPRTNVDAPNVEKHHDAARAGHDLA